LVILAVAGLIYSMLRKA
ncbi:major capsid protein, partial [Pseudomonas aeruginosa]|nr:major capsid protein [Pseudomonas aeruginosa]MBG5353806.1 major capsid protein [Pseudomonas aeruginosa]MBG5769330.1 major capsid protein [Pseudomonas aeruginosa]MBG6516377.1 major capsid protein [Pseudomonas aeruginosa]MBG6752476.1 major capsid protein [Pseudomonas aeruginosa]